MSSANILVLGGSGFLGRYLVPRLDAAGHRITVPTRNRERARHLILLPKTDVEESNIRDDGDLDRLVSGKEVVVNLVGILHGRLGSLNEPYGPDFGEVHVRLMERVIACAKRHKVARLIQVSALGVTDNDPATLPSRYLRSKAAAEKLLRESGLNWVIFRPSVMFGPGDSFLSLFATLQRFTPVIAVPKADARFQPVYVADVADAIVRGVDDPAMTGRVFELAGPDVYTLRDLIHLAGRYSGHERRVFNLPLSLGHLQALVMEKLPGRTLMSRDNLMSMKVDNVASGPIDPRLGIEPTPVTTIAPTYLGPIESAYNAERRARH
jgi:NADH dehydrogenase